MKSLKSYYDTQKCLFGVLFCLFVFASCNTKMPQNSSLREADEVVWSAPNRTLTLVDSLKKVHLSSNDLHIAAFLHEHVMYRMQQPLTESNLPLLIGFFQQSDNMLYAGRASYLLGAELSWMNQPYDAIRPLKDAEEYLTRCNSRDLYLGMTYYKLGRIYDNEFLFEQAHELYKKALPIFEEYNHSRYLSFTYRDLARTMTDTIENNIPIIQEYYRNALRYAQTVNDTLLYYENLCFAHQFLKDEYEENYLEMASVLCRTKHPVDAIWLYEYYFPDNLDSAKTYLDVLASDTLRSIYSKHRYHYFSSQYLYAKGQTDSAFCELDREYNNYNQEIANSNLQRMYAITQQYDSAKANERAKEEMLQKQFFIICASLSILAMSIVVIILIWRLGIRKQKETRVLELLQDQRHELEMKEQHLKDELSKQLELSKQIRILRMANAKDIIGDGGEKWNQLLKQWECTPQKVDEYIRNYQKLVPDWKEKYNLQHKNMTSQEINIFILMLLNLSINDISLLLNLTNRSLYNYRNRIKQHLGLSENEDLDEWIRKGER